MRCCVRLAVSRAACLSIVSPGRGSAGPLMSSTLPWLLYPPALKATAGELGPILLRVPWGLPRCDQQPGDTVWA